ncbi:MAG: hypothetical protein ACI9K2_007637, partial [Myxococcota bacterium]
PGAILGESVERVAVQVDRPDHAPGAAGMP